MYIYARQQKEIRTETFFKKRKPAKTERLMDTKTKRQKATQKEKDNTQEMIDRERERQKDEQIEK